MRGFLYILLSYGIILLSSALFQSQSQPLFESHVFIPFHLKIDLIAGAGIDIQV